MKTTIITDPLALLGVLENLVEWSEEVSMAFAWAGSQEGKGKHWQALDLDKVSRAVIGTQFAQTEPWVLIELDRKPDRLRVVIDSIGTFHPKIIIGRRGAKARALVGSANFTTAAYTKNAEVSVLLDGGGSDQEFEQLQEFIDEQFELGTKLDKEWLASYEIAWDVARRRKNFVPGAKLELTSVESLSMSWDDYVDLISAQENRELSPTFRLRVQGPFPSYAVELDRAQAIFATGQPFADLSREQRGMLIGVGPQSSGFLGTMKAAGFAKQIVYQFPEKIGAALDRLPLEGTVPLSLVGSILEGVTSLNGVKIGVATRLLAVKRPDLFVSVNKGSNPKLATLLGGREVKKPKAYLSLLSLVWDTDWHNSARPSDKVEAILWDRRAAMLDAALYEEVRSA